MYLLFYKNCWNFLLAEELHEDKIGANGKDNDHVNGDGLDDDDDDIEVISQGTIPIPITCSLGFYFDDATTIPTFKG